jgi:glycosyltransferase involved in cell wall biosynthesis
LVAGSTGLGETVVEGVTGYTFIPDNEQSLARSLLCLAHSRMLRRQLGRAGRELVLQNFSLSLYHTRIVNAVDSVVRRKT